MKAYLLRRSGKPAVLKMTEVPEPEPMPGEVKVRLAFAGLNYAEILSRKGLYGWAPERPYIPGMEGAGEIVAVGEGVAERRLGAGVIVGAQYGCYAEYICVPSGQTLNILPELDLAENAAMLVNYLTAWVALVRLGRIGAGDSVLITAAAGGVGTAAVQISRAFGARVYGMAGSDERAAFIESLGARKGFNYRRTDSFDKLRTLSGGLDIVLEMNGGAVYRQTLSMLNPFGRMVVMGYASLDYRYWNPVSLWRAWRGIPRVSIPAISEQSAGVMSSHLGYLLKQPALMHDIYRELEDFLTKHRIRPVIDRIFSFAELPEAHRYIEARRQKGKVVVKIKE